MLAFLLGFPDASDWYRIRLHCRRPWLIPELGRSAGDLPTPNLPAPVFWPGYFSRLLTYFLESRNIESGSLVVRLFVLLLCHGRGFDPDQEVGSHKLCSAAKKSTKTFKT